jgi:predicted permease
MYDWRWLRRLTIRLRSLVQRNRVERELEEEFRFHLEQRIELEIARGRTPEDARLAAIRGMDGLEQRKEECRDLRRVNYIDDLLRDLRYASRNLRRSPAFATLTILIMALGIGANTAVFSVVHTVLLKPLSYRDPDRIVTLTDFMTTGEAPTRLSRQVSIPDFQDWHQQTSSFDALAYYASREAPVILGSTSEYARVATVSPEFFRIFGIEPVVGRFFTAEEGTRPGGAALISYPYWQSHFGGDSGVLGQTIRAFGPRPIVGVLPPGFRFPDQTDVWVPALPPTAAAPAPRSGQNFLAVALLKPGAALEQAQTEMTLIARRLEQQYPDSNKGRSVAVARMRDQMVGDVRFTLYLLLAAVTVVLLIACANTATLLLGKATARTREVAVRVALGASRPRIARQLVTESLLLAAISGLSGLVLAYWGSKALVALAPADVPRLAETGIDRSVLAFTLGISLITSLLFGLVPALSTSRVNWTGTLTQRSARTVGGRSMVRARGAIVVIEIALAAVLVSGAGLLLKSFIALHNVPLGFRPENVLIMRATVPAPPNQATARTRQFFQEIQSRVARLPGVLAAGVTMAPPGLVDATGVYFVDHKPEQMDPASAAAVVLSIVGPGTFAALGIPLKGGRDFRESDALDRPAVAVVNEALVRKSFGNQDPLGRTIYCPFDSFDGMTIIGVIGDVRQRGPAREPMPECYMTYAQHAFNGLSVVARTAGDPHVPEDTMRRLVRETSPDIPMKFTTLDAMLSDNIAADRFRTVLFAIFARLGGVPGCCRRLRRDGVRRRSAARRDRRADRIGREHPFGASTDAGPGISLDSCWHHIGARRHGDRCAVAFEHAVPGTADRSAGVFGRRGSPGSGGFCGHLHSGPTRIEHRSADGIATGVASESCDADHESSALTRAVVRDSGDNNGKHSRVVHESTRSR